MSEGGSAAKRARVNNTVRWQFHAPILSLHYSHQYLHSRFVVCINSIGIIPFFGDFIFLNHFSFPFFFFLLGVLLTIACFRFYLAKTLLGVSLWPRWYSCWKARSTKEVRWLQIETWEVKALLKKKEIQIRRLIKLGQWSWVTQKFRITRISQTVILAFWWAELACCQ